LSGTILGMKKLNKKMMIAILEFDHMFCTK